MERIELVSQRELVRRHLAGVQPRVRLDVQQRQTLRDKIIRLLEQYNASIIAHYYVDGDIQQLADESGGFVGDSLEMARFGAASSADILVVAGVRFMGESAKILSPEKTILMPDLAATCSLDLSCPADEFTKFCDQHPDRLSVVYANTSAEVKARADWVVTSSIAVEVIEQLHSEGHKLIWAPDKHLGNYLKQQTGADLLIWDGACIVHEEFKAQGLRAMKAIYPEAAVMVHPESPQSVIELADVVGSTSQLIKQSTKLKHKTFIVATDQGIFYKMREANKGQDKEFIPAPTSGRGATCRSCASCPWMGMNSLENLASCLEERQDEITIPSDTLLKAQNAISRMMNFKAANYSN